VDVAPSDLSQVVTALRKLAAAARQSDGNRGFELLQQINRPNHFNLISAWVGETPLYAFAAKPATREIRRILGPLLGAPYDERFYRRVN
jgi:quinol monooxygenase YgiN